jgi:hypothetical protein
MSLVQTIARLGFAPNLASAWLTSFAIGAAVAIPTAILVAPSARRLAGHLIGTPRNAPPGNRQQVGSGERSQAKGASDPPEPGQQGLNSLVLTPTAGRPAQADPGGQPEPGIPVGDEGQRVGGHPDAPSTKPNIPLR